MTGSREPNKILTPGPCTFYVKWATSRDKSLLPLMTKAGDRKCMVVLTCTDSAGETGDVYQHMTAERPYFLNQLMTAVGLPLHYTAEMVVEDAHPLKGLSGRCILQIDEHEMWGKSMKVKEYLQPLMLKPTSVQQTLVEEFDDEIPF